MDPAQPTPEQPGTPHRLPIGLVLFVCLVGIVVGGFFGQIAGGGYAIIDSIKLDYVAQPDRRAKDQTPGYGSGIDVNILSRVGLRTGIGTGLLAAMLWCRCAVSRVNRKGRWKLISYGARLGLLVGCIATVFLHATLISASPAGDFILLLIGLACGLIAGAAAGAACGAVCLAVLKRPQENP